MYLCFLLFVGKFTSVFKDKKAYRNHKTVEIKVYLLCLIDDGRIRIQVRIRIRTKMTDPDPGGPKTYGSGSTALAYSMNILHFIQDSTGTYFPAVTSHTFVTDPGLRALYLRTVNPHLNPGPVLPKKSTL
jgi:hypothetical protein